MILLRRILVHAIRKIIDNIFLKDKYVNRLALASHGLTHHMLRTRHFDNIYISGMELIDACNCYLHSESKEDCSKMQPAVRDLYSAHAVNLTTNVMRLASLLIMLKSVRDGDVLFEDAILEINNCDVIHKSLTSAPGIEFMPETLINLIRLTKELRFVTNRFYSRLTCKSDPSPNVVHLHFARVQNAFLRGRP